MQHVASADVPPLPAPLQHGDLAAMARVMRPLYVGAGTPSVADERRLVADLFRLVGSRFGVPSAGPATPTASGVVVPTGRPSPAGGPPVADGELTPRAAETLRHLLAGDSEKQVARRMRLSPHTVHGHVKTLYKHFNVSSRAELLARHLRG